MADTTDNQGQQGETITLYEAIGGDAAVRALTRRFYALMDPMPEAARCRAIHPPDLSGSEDKLYEYLSGWLGGPPLYTEKRGHPMLRRRHFARGLRACFFAGLDFLRSVAVALQLGDALAQPGADVLEVGDQADQGEGA